MFWRYLKVTCAINVSIGNDTYTESLCTRTLMRTKATHSSERGARCVLSLCQHMPSCVLVLGPCPESCSPPLRRLLYSGSSPSCNVLLTLTIWGSRVKKRIWRSFQLGWRDKALLHLEQSSRKNKECSAWGIPGGPYILLCYHLHVCVFSLAQEIQPKSSQAAFRAAKAIECWFMLILHTRENIIKHLDWECITCNPHIASYCPTSRNTADAT